MIQYFNPAKRLANRAIKSPSVNFQIANIALMLFQSFVAPFIIGVASFGAQMLFLAPVFLAQALLEPSYQAELNVGTVDSKCRVNLTSILLQGTVLMMLATWATIGDYGLTLIVLVALFNSIFTVVLAATFALSEFKLAAIARYISLIAYIPTFVIMFLVGLRGEIIVANLIGYACASIIVGVALIRLGRIEFHFGNPELTTLAGGLSYRLPTICFTAFTTIILGFIGAASTTIGEFRIFMSAVSAGRFINVVPLPRLQVGIQNYLLLRHSNFKQLLQQYLGSYVIFCTCLVLFFPHVYEMAFGTRTFTHINLMAASVLILAQPLAYFIFAIKPHKWSATVIFPIMLSVGSMTLFYYVSILSKSAVHAASLSIAATFLTYSLTAYCVSKKNVSEIK